LLISQVLPINRELIGGIYFDDSAIHALEALLRSTSTISGVEDMLLESNFFHLHLEFTKKETHEIRNNLRELSYNIDSISVLPLVAGPGRRIEEVSTELQFKASKITKYYPLVRISVTCRTREASSASHEARLQRISVA